MKVVITVIGRDKIGIVAQIAKTLANLQINIIDISQTLMQGNFTMILIGQWEQKQISFKEVKNKFTNLAKKIGLDIHVQPQELFDKIQKL